jgi:hypothetical protein
VLLGRRAEIKRSLVRKGNPKRWHLSEIKEMAERALHYHVGKSNALCDFVFG